MTKAEDNTENEKCCGKYGCHATKVLSAEEQKKLDFYNAIIQEINQIKKAKEEYGTK